MNRLAATAWVLVTTWSISVAGSALAQSGTPPWNGWLGGQQQPVTPHPAVARIIVPEADGVAYGSGTLVGHTAQLGLVVTNWHVVRGAAGTIMVVFPDGFRSAGRVLRVDRDWDLAALAIWRPQAKPVAVSGYAPQPGETLVIAGYGQGQYRSSAGRVTQYVAPGGNFPFEMVEVSTGAREGDSGGPILNTRGELAGVLFGSSSGRTMGSYSGRVRGFLNTVLDDFQRLDTTPPGMMVADARSPAGATPNAAAPSVAAAVPSTSGGPVPTASRPSDWPPNSTPVAMSRGPAAAAPRTPVVAEPVHVTASVSRPAKEPRRQPPRREPDATSEPEAVAFAGTAAVESTVETQEAVARPEPVVATIANTSETSDAPSAEAPVAAVTAGGDGFLSGIDWAEWVGKTRGEQIRNALAGLGVVLLSLKILGLFTTFESARPRAEGSTTKRRRTRSRSRS